MVSVALLSGVVASTIPEESVLQTIAGLNDFTEDTTRRYTPFCVTGTVQVVGKNGYLIISDTGFWTEMRHTTDRRPAPGDRIMLSGLAHMSSRQEIDIVADRLEMLGTDTVAPPLKLAIGELSTEKHHLRAVETEGIVIDAFPDEIDAGYRFLIIKDAECILPVAVPSEAGSELDIPSLRDAKIRIRGHFIRTVSGSRKFSGPFISIDNADDLTVITPAPADPLAAPPLERSIYRTPREIAKRGKRSVSGEVLAVWNRNRMMVRTDKGRIVNVTLAHGESVPRSGEYVTVAGYPETDLFRVNLARALVRAEDRRTEPPPETAITDLATVFGGKDRPNAIDPASHGRLMRVRGTIQIVPSPNTAERRMLLACGPYKLPIDLGVCDNAAEDIAIGTELEVTGRCVLEIDNWDPDDVFPRIRNLVAVIRTPADLKVIALPPWWTPIRLLVVISILIAALIGIYIWNRVLQKLVNRRGRELYREQVAHAVAEFKTGERTRLAVELHDSLSQSLAGVAWQVAASTKTLVSNPEVAKRCLETADKMLGSCRTELRQCLFDLRSDTLEEPDFSTAIRKTLGQLDGRAAITVRFNVPRQRFKDTTAHAILAIVRELTGNAIRHGDASEIKVAGAIEPGRILFSVRDNGKGFDPQDCNGPAQGHFGLEGIRNRLEKINGNLDIESTPGAGTKATVTIPLPQSI